MPYYDQNGQPIGYDPSGYGGSSVADVPADYGRYATLSNAIDQRKGIVGPALKSGMYDLAGLLGAGVGAVGGAVGSDAVRDFGVGVSNDMQARSEAAGRPDLEVMPWSQRWGQDGQTMADIPKWMLYQVGKQVPQIGAAMLGGGLVGAGMKAAGVVAPGAELAATLPEWMGGGGLRAGMAAEEASAARKAGADLAQQYMGTTVAGLPQAAGSMYQSEIERSQQTGTPLDQGAAQSALGLSPLYSMLDAATPSERVGILKRGLSGNLGRRMATAALSEGAQEMVQEAAQTGMEMGFRPDLSTADKAQNIVDAAIVGGLVGGVLGGASGIRRLANKNPANISTQDMMRETGEETQPTGSPLPQSQQPVSAPSLSGINTSYKELTKNVADNAPHPDTLNSWIDALYTHGFSALDENGKSVALGNGIKKRLREYGLIAENAEGREQPQPIEDAITNVQAQHLAAQAELAQTQPNDPEFAARQKRVSQLGGYVSLLKNARSRRPEGALTPSVNTTMSEEEAPPPPPPMADDEVAAYTGIPDPTADLSIDDEEPLVTNAATAPTEDVNPDAAMLTSMKAQDRARLANTIKAAGPDGLDVGENLTVAYDKDGGGWFYMTPEDTSNGFNTFDEMLADLTERNPQAVNEAKQEEAAAYDQDWPGSIEAALDEEAARDQNWPETFRSAENSAEGSAPRKGGVYTPSDARQEKYDKTRKVTEAFQETNASATKNGKPSPLKPAAEALLRSADEGGMPGFITKQMRATAEAEGITITKTMTPQDVIDAVRAKRDAASAPVTENVNPAPAPATRVGPSARFSGKGDNRIVVKDPVGRKVYEEAVFNKTQITHKAGGKTTILKPGQMEGVSPELATAAQSYFDAKNDTEKAAAKEAVRQAMDAPYLAAEPSVGTPTAAKPSTPTKTEAQRKADIAAARADADAALTQARMERNKKKVAEKQAQGAATAPKTTAPKTGGKSSLEADRAAFEDANREEWPERNVFAEAGYLTQDVVTLAKAARSLGKSKWADAKTLPIAQTVMRGWLTRDEAISDVRRTLEGETRDVIDRWAGEMGKFYDNIEKTLRKPKEPKGAAGRAITKLRGVAERINAANPEALDRLTKLMRNTDNPKREDQVIDAMRELGVEVTSKDLAEFGASLANTGDPPTMLPPRQPVKNAIKRTAQSIQALGENYVSPIWTEEVQSSASRRALARNFKAERASALTENDARTVEDYVLRIDNKREIRQVRDSGPAGEQQLEVKGKELLVLGRTTVGEAHKELLGLTQSKVLRQLMPLVSRISDIPVILVPHGDLQAVLGGGHAYYDPDEGHIVMPADYGTTEERAHWLMHEGVHAALMDRLDNDADARAELRRIAKALKKSGLVGENDYAFTDPHEFLAEVLSRESLQKALAKLEMPNNLTGWRYFVAKAMEWLGFRGPQNALEGVLQVRDFLMRPETRPMDMRKTLENALGKNVDRILSDRENADAHKRLLAVASRQIASGADTAIGRVTGWLNDKMNEMETGPQTLKFRLAQSELYWSSYGHILNKFGKMFEKVVDGKTVNPLRNWGDAMNQRVAITARLARLFGIEDDRLNELDKANPKLRIKEKLSRLMAISTEFGLDPEKKWDEVKNLPHITTMVHTDKERLEQIEKAHAEAVSLFQDLKRDGKAGQNRNVYHAYRDLNAMLLNSSQAVMLYNLVREDPYFAGDTSYASSRPSLDEVRKDPVESFLKDKELHDNPAEAAKFWKGEIDRRLRDVTAYMAHMEVQRASLSKQDWENYERSQRPLNLMLKELRDQLKTMDEAPYFHLGRHGDFMVRFNMEIDPDTAGTSDERAKKDTVEKVSARLSQLGFGISLSPENSRPYAMARFESKDKADAFLKAVKQLKAEGLVTSVSNDTRSNIRNDAANQPVWLSRYIEAIRNNSALDYEQQRHMVSIARQVWLDQLSDTAVARVMAQRQTVPGYNKDMLRNFAFRAEVGINSLANLSVSAKVSEAFGDMDEMRKDESFKNHDKSDAMMRVVQELRQRDADRPLTTGKSWIDTWRAINQTFFLGMSPAYTMVNMTQLGVMLLPELAKRHGFVKSAQAMAKVTKAAFNIIRETYTEGRKVSFSRALDAIITSDVLERALPGDANRSMRDFLTRMVNSGNIDLGSPMRELGRRSDGIQSSNTDFALRFASAMGYYSETLTRLIAAMSAHELMQGKDSTVMDRYAGDVLNEAMLNYSNWYTARATGKTGVLGQFTPIPASFQQYTLQVFQKLYRELGEAFSAKQDGESDKAWKERKTAARRFLYGHSAALTLLAGSLGLPFTTVAMRAADWLRDLWDDDEPHDTRTDYRNFLADVFGKDIGEVLARGMPRALGFDISGRVGEQDMAPFSRFIADRRKMEDAAKDLVFRSVGSPVSMVAGMANGGWEMSQGNYMKGLQMMVPNSIKGVLKGVQMAEGGYQDETGTPLPMQADPTDIAWQLAGFNPAEKAEYTEANLARTTRKTALQREASSIRNDLVDQARDGAMDPAALREAAQFDMKHPEYAILPSLGSTINRRKQQELVARKIGAPLGVKPEDLEERRRLGFANFL